MRSLKILKCLLVAGFVLLLGLSWSTAEENKEISASEQLKENNLSKVKDIQGQQAEMRVNYEHKKKDLEGQLQGALKDLKEEPGKSTRKKIIAENMKQQQVLRNNFQDNLRNLQVEERKIRLGRETLERSDLTGGKQAEVYSEALTEKQKRLELQKRREDQDKILLRDRQAEKTQPSASPTKPPVPGVPQTPAKKFGY